MICNAKQKILAISCGVVTSISIFYFIPCFFMKGVPDIVWILSMLLLPTIEAVILLYFIGKSPLKSLWGSLLVEFLIALLFHKPIGELLGYRSHSITGDLFDFVAYLMFTFGWAIAATFTQFVVLIALHQYKQS